MASNHTEPEGPTYHGNPGNSHFAAILVAIAFFVFIMLALGVCLLCCYHMRSGRRAYLPAALPNGELHPASPPSPPPALPLSAVVLDQSLATDAQYELLDLHAKPPTVYRSSLSAAVDDATPVQPRSFV